MKQRTLWFPLLTAMLFGASLANCGDSSDEDCTPGAVGCKCTDLGQCLTGLSCLSSICVDPSSMSSASASASASGSGTTTDTGPDPTTSPTTSESESEGSEVGGPKILQFLTNVSSITDVESVTFTAVVTDPDGVSDVIGGSLTSPDGKISYGAFATSGEEGAYELSLSWQQIHQAETLHFESLSVVRTFRAEFFDQGGKSAWKTIDITLTCDNGNRVTPAACDGVCTDLDSDDLNCSACGKACMLYYNNPEIGACSNSACAPTFLGCVHESEFINCNETCAAFGEACVVGGCDDDTSRSNSSDQCDKSGNISGNGGHTCTEQIDGTWTYTMCCCTQTL